MLSNLIPLPSKLAADRAKMCTSSQTICYVSQKLSPRQLCSLSAEIRHGLPLRWLPASAKHVKKSCFFPDKRASPKPHNLAVRRGMARKPRVSA